MFGDGPLMFREFVMREPHPLAVIHDAVLEFLRDRTDAALYGAQAVNAYVSEARLTQDVALASTRAAELAEELRAFLHMRFHIAVRAREVRGALDTASTRCGSPTTGTWSMSGRSRSCLLRSASKRC